MIIIKLMECHYNYISFDSRHNGTAASLKYSGAAKRAAVVYDIEGGVAQSIPADDFSGVVLNNVLQLKHGSTRGAQSCVWNPAQADEVRKNRELDNRDDTVSISLCAQESVQPTPQTHMDRV